MNKKILSIIFSLFLVGVFSISCSNSDKTGSVDNSKGIEQYNGNIYASESKDIFGSYLWLQVKGKQIAFVSPSDNTSMPDFSGETYFDVEGSGSSYTVKIPDSVGMPKFTLEFSSDGSTVNAEITYLINDGTEPHDEKYQCVKKN
ncbi:hypothetical protein R4J18_10390 [Brachyspira pilosicoli]|uniref:hypothetical protein n=1 Tax=Brachyspira pilosicoli TaxID=52584 RepID=UPI0030062578